MTPRRARLATPTFHRGIATLSQTSYHPLYYSPPAVSIGTKIEGEEGQEARLQLSTWGYAQMMALKKLLHMSGRSDATIPSFPLFAVHGGTWSFIYFEVRPDCTVRWEEVLIGRTTTIRGV